MTAQPIPVRVLRYKCPHCSRSASRPGRTREHMARCWSNPEAHGCKTCEHFEPYGPEWDDSCDAGVDLTGREQCSGCHGLNWVHTGEIFRPRFGKAGPVKAKCTDCGGNGAEVKPGPIVHCPQWELRTEEDQ